MSKIGPIACPPRSRFDGAMPRDPFVREKFTRAHGRPQARCGILSALPQGPLSAEVESWRLLQSAKHRIHTKRLREPIEGAE